MTGTLNPENEWVWDHLVEQTHPNHIDFGWMVIERDKPSHDKFLRTLNYIQSNVDSHNILELPTGTPSDIFAAAVGEGSGLKVRRHIIPNLETLQLIQRLPPRIRGVWRLRITPSGLEYMTSNNMRRSFEEKIMSNYIFCQNPWGPDTRLERYGMFNVNIFRVVNELIMELDNVIWLEEFMFFISKIKNHGEIQSTLERIQQYRDLSDQNVIRLKQYIDTHLRHRGTDTSGNWRKFCRYAMLLFGMGVSFDFIERNGQREWNYSTNPHTFPLRRKPRGEWGFHEDTLVTIPVGDEVPRSLDEFPDLPRTDERINSGILGEQVVRNELLTRGYEVRDLSKLNLGFDLLAMMNDRRYAIEVKSSIDRMGQIVLTQNEWETAERWRQNYYIALVSFVTSNPQIQFLRDPYYLFRESISEETARSFVIRRFYWTRQTENFP